MTVNQITLLIIFVLRAPTAQWCVYIFHHVCIDSEMLSHRIPFLLFDPKLHVITIRECAWLLVEKRQTYSMPCSCSVHLIVFAYVYRILTFLNRLNARPSQDPDSGMSVVSVSYRSNLAWRGETNCSSTGEVSQSGKHESMELTSMVSISIYLRDVWHLIIPAHRKTRYPGWVFTPGVRGIHHGCEYVFWRSWTQARSSTRSLNFEKKSWVQRS